MTLIAPTLPQGYRLIDDGLGAPTVVIPAVSHNENAAPLALRTAQQIRDEAITVQLTATELYRAIEQASKRHEQSASSKMRNFVGNKSFNVLNDIFGACAEFALGKLLNAAHDETVGTYRKRNVAGIYCVKATAIRDGVLIVRPKDPESGIGVLGIIKSNFDVTFVGWLAHSDARRAEWYRSLNGSSAMAWCVPQSALKPMKELQ